MQPSTAAAPITSAEQIPQHTANLVRKGGAIALRDEDRRMVAALDLGAKQVLLLWAGESISDPLLQGVRQRVLALEYAVLGVREASTEVIALLSEDSSDRESTDALEQTDVLKLLDQILSEAARLRASDVHFQQRRRHCDVVFRINGELTKHRQVTAEEGLQLARAAYSKADVDSRRGKPTFNPRSYQDASLTRALSVNGEFQETKLRWGSGPVWPDAFDVSLRLLNGSGRVSTMDSLGLRADQIDALMTALKAPSGVIVLCGTTGAGKTTTLASLAEMWLRRHGGRRLLRTIEDPPENEIPMARQMPVSRSDRGEEEGFHTAMRAVLRMDPDALLLGEVRDAVTADLLQQAVQTGHKVLTSVHAPSCFAALARFTTLGISRDYLASDGFINAIVHQYLVSTLCPHCSVPLAQSNGYVERDTMEDIELLLAGNLEHVRVRGAGCQHCTEGHKGRKAVATILMPDGRMLDMIRRGSDAEAREYWRSGRMPLSGKTQATSAVQHAAGLIQAGELCPNEAELVLGRLLDSQT